MPQTVIAYSQSIGANVLTTVDGVPDPHVRVEREKIYVPGFATRVLGIFGCSPNLQRLRLVSPTLRTFANIEASPIQSGSSAPGSPPAVQLFENNPVPSTTNDIMTVEALQAEPTGAAERVTAVVLLIDARPTPVTDADIRSVRCTTDVTLTANAWTNAAITFEESWT